MTKILVIGKNGQLGKSIHRLVVNTRQADDFIFVGRRELDLSKNESIANYCNGKKFDIIINCAAYTAVDKAEEEVELANQINHLAVGQLAQIAQKQRAKLIHISTDYVFDGESDKPYTETDATNPINVYGKTKLAGEKAIQKAMPTNAIIIRTSWVYSEYGNNFVDTMLRLGRERGELSVVSDQIGSPTYAANLAGAILEIIKNEEFKNMEQVARIYHYSDKGIISWYEFAKEIFKIARIDCKVNSITAKQYPTPAKRPVNSAMSQEKTSKLLAYNWNESLQDCIKNINKK